MADLVIDKTKQSIINDLQIAFQLELGTIPPYLTAILSLHPQDNRVAANLIHSVMMEEMLHLLLVGNLIVSLGGKVKISSEILPTYPLNLHFESVRFKDRQFDVNLEAFSKDALDTFLQIELPQTVAEEVELMAAALLVPALTIGEFYERISNRLEALCKEIGEEALFSNKASQLGKRFYWYGQGVPVEIDGLSAAKNAIDLIVKQGEGSWSAKEFSPPNELAHYYKFKQIEFGRYYRVGDSPSDAPSGETFEVDYARVFPILKNPQSTDYAPGTRLDYLNNEFNRQYTLMLIQLGEAINGAPETMYTAIMNGMHGLMPIAQEMVATPIEGRDDKAHGCPTFEWLNV